VLLSTHERNIDFLSSFTYFVSFIIFREVENRICIAGGDPTLVESPTEPKWSSKGICIQNLILVSYVF